MIVAALLGLTLVAQKPDNCLGATSTAGSPYCFASTLVDGLSFMARAYRQEQDSIAAAVATGNIETTIRTLVYWTLERKRVGRRACKELGAFNKHADSLAVMLPGAFCAVVERMIAGDSTSLANRLADLDAPSRRAVTATATRDALLRQSSEEESRDFFAITAGFTHVLLDGSPSGRQRNLLRVTSEERAALLVDLRRIQVESENGGVFAQAAQVLLEWLSNPGWKSKPG